MLGLWNSLYQSPSTRKPAKPSYILHRAKPSNTRGGEGLQVCSPQHQESFYSNFYLVSKKGGQIRPVINLKKLNEWVAPRHFKMESMGTLKCSREWLYGEDKPQRCTPYIIRFWNLQYINSITSLHASYLASPVPHWYSPKWWNPFQLEHGGVYDCLHTQHTIVEGHLDALIYLLTGLGFVINLPK